MAQRRSGVLAHITMLPSEYGIGDIGPAAYEFADFLVNSGQTVWQILPTNPTEMGCGNSPYGSTSAFAGNPLFISPDLLVEDGLLCRAECEVASHKDKIDYQKVTEFKNRILDKAFSRFKVTDDYIDFCNQNEYWLNEYVIFKAIRDSRWGQTWREWPEGLQNSMNSDPTLLQNARKEMFIQYEFFKQWKVLRNFCNSRGLKLFGDMPIYVGFESADVWAHQELFHLDPETKKPLTVSGAPPDTFSDVGQKWNHPTYLWDKHRETGFAWWLKRITHTLQMVDLLRIDHFRGLVSYWEIPEASPAVDGHWVRCPHEDFFNTLSSTIDMSRLVAEDLGQIDDDVRSVMSKYNIPGMKLLQFAFGRDMPTSVHVPHNHPHNAVVYTGTHDNNTVRGWFDDDLSMEDKFRLFEYCGREIYSDQISWHMIDQAMRSVADTSIMAVQDILALGTEARVNKPGSGDYRFEWKLVPDQLNFNTSNGLNSLAKRFGRI